MDHFEDASQVFLRQRELFIILVSERRLRHRELRHKGKLTRESYTGDLRVVRKHVKLSRKYRIY